MAPTLLVTNDFPPRAGGIQTYLHALAAGLPAGELTVLAPAASGARAFDAAFTAATGHPVHRHRRSLLVPVPDVAAAATDLARSYGSGTVWFGAAAPLGLLGPVLRRRAGVHRVLASTHGHEIGWSLLPGARGALRRIAADADVLTTVSAYTRRALTPVCGPGAVLAPLPPAVDTTAFRPDPAARNDLRRRYRLGQAPVVTCVSRLVRRKGQDVLLRALPQVLAAVPGARLVLVGSGPAAAGLRRAAVAGGVGDQVVFTGAVPPGELAAHHAVGDVFALPCRTRAGGLDTEGLGIALLEAAASGLPVVAGRSGGAPEAVRDGRTGLVVDGRDPVAVAAALVSLLRDPQRAAAMGAAGRAWMGTEWAWPDRVARLRTLLDG